MLGGPEPVRRFALYLPSSILVTLAFDLGRAETVLRFGMSAVARRRRLLEASVLAAGALVVLAVLPFTVVSLGAKTIAALIVSGVLQTYVDMFVRLNLFQYRRSLYIYIYQCLLATVTAIAAGAITVRAIKPEWGLAVIVVSPSLILMICSPLLTVFLRGAPATPTERRGPSDNLHIVAAVAYRAFPPAAYTAYVAILSKLAPEVAATARAFYFVFGFLHMRRMAREAKATAIFRTAGLLLVSTLALSVPTLATTSPWRSITWFSLLACIVISAFASLLFAAFLHRYARFLNEDEALTRAPCITVEAG